MRITTIFEQELKKLKPEPNDTDVLKVAKLFYGFTLKDFDVLAAITGPKGMGKSSLAIQIARRILELQDKKFDPNRHVAYLYEDVIDKINQLEEREPLIIDEAVNVMMSEDWNKIESKYLKKVFAKLRVRHLIVFLCIPKFEWLDKKYREGMVNFWLLVPTRGKFILLTKKEFSDDAWGLEKIQKAFGKYNYLDVVSGFDINENTLRQFGLDVAIGTFDKVPDEIYDKYLELRVQAIEKSTEQGEVVKIEASKIPMLIKIYEMKNLGIKDEEIAKQLGISKQAVIKYKRFIQGG